MGEAGVSVRCLAPNVLKGFSELLSQLLTIHEPFLPNSADYPQCPHTDMRALPHFQLVTYGCSVWSNWRTFECTRYPSQSFINMQSGLIGNQTMTFPKPNLVILVPETNQTVCNNTSPTQSLQCPDNQSVLTLQHGRQNCTLI